MTRTKKPVVRSAKVPTAKPATAAKAANPADVRGHLERAAAGTDTWTELMTAWSKLPAAEIADAIAQKPLDPMIADVITGDAREGEARLLGIDRARDPRLADVLVRWICDPPWHATGSQPFWRGVFARLEELADPRSIAALADARRGPKKIKGASMRGWMLERMTRTRDALIARYPDGVPALSTADAKLARAAARHAASAKVTAKKKTASTDAADRLLAEIYANPADDAPRQVYADLLVQRGDPRGEFIHLQLARNRRKPTGGERAAELKLLNKHARSWLGELVPAVGGVARYRLRVGPVDEYDFCRFERGFLTGAWLIDGRYLKPVIASPQLATLETVTIDDWEVPLLATAKLPALHRLRIRDQLSASSVDQLVKAPWAKQLARLEVSAELEHLLVVIARVVTLPLLRELVTGFDDSDDVVRTMAKPVLELAKQSKLERIEIAGRGVLSRKGARWEPDAAARAFLASLA